MKQASEVMPVVVYGTEEGERHINTILSRTQLDYGDIQKVVDEIISDVKANKDAAVFKYTKRFDGFNQNSKNIKVTEKEIAEAYKQVDSQLIEIIKRAILRISDFHSKQKQNTWIEPSINGDTMGQLIRPLQRVGIYVPGGKAAYPSSVLMNAIPAKVAGVSEIVMTTPCDSNGIVNPVILVAAAEASITEIYKVGGAQSIAAMAFGTETIPKVDKIVGPGNIYVALAKRSVFGYVNIDSVAGPSEILIIADDKAKPKFIAADLLSQAEHDELASAILITNNKKIAEKVQKEIKNQMENLERKDIIEKSLNNYGAIVLVEDLEQAADLSNKIAPEHLELCVKDAFSFLNLIRNAGAIFMGNYSPEPIGDYMAGPNHVLPTGGTARFFSPLSIDDFIKKSSIISFNKHAFMNISKDVIKFANAEGLTAHANSIEVRLK